MLGSEFNVYLFIKFYQSEVSFVRVKSDKQLYFESALSFLFKLLEIFSTVLHTSIISSSCSALLETY